MPVGLLDFDKSYDDIVPSPDATRVATLDSDGTVRLWSVLTGQPLSVVMRHEDPVSTV